MRYGKSETLKSIEELQDSALEMVGRYYITKRISIHDKIFKFGYNPDAVMPYATWQSNKSDPANSYWGHYWKDEPTANRDFYRRIQAERTGEPYDHTTLIKAYWRCAFD